MKPWECDGCKWCYRRAPMNGGYCADYFCTFTRFNQPEGSMKYGRIVNIERKKSCNHGGKQ